MQVLACLTPACTGQTRQPSPTLDAGAPTPPPLQLENVRVEQRQAGRLRWSAHAREGHGSPQHFEMTELSLQVGPTVTEKGESPTIFARRGTLHLELGMAELEGLEGRDGKDLRVTAPAALWERSASHWVLHGPILLTNRALSLQAGAAQITWPEGELRLTEDVHGTFSPAQIRAP